MSQVKGQAVGHLKINLLLMLTQILNNNHIGFLTVLKNLKSNYHNFVLPEEAFLIKGNKVGIWKQNIWIPNFLKFGFQMVWYSNGCFCIMSYVLDWPLECQTSTYEKNGFHLSGIQMVRLWPVVKWHLNTRPFGIQPLSTIWIPN